MGKSTSDETYSKPSDKVVSPVGKQLITVKDRANFVLEHAGTTYCNLLCVSRVTASLHQEHTLEIQYLFQYKVLSGESYLPVKALSPLRWKLYFRENISWKCSCELICLLFS